MIYEFKGYRGCASRCDIRINKVGRHQVVVLATELPDNPGTSITNMAEDLAREICVKNSIPFDQLVWIEHYPEWRMPLTDMVCEATYYRVSFDIDMKIKSFSKPRREWILKETVEALTVGGRLIEDQPVLWQQIKRITGINDVDYIHDTILAAVVAQFVSTGHTEAQRLFIEEKALNDMYREEQEVLKKKFYEILTPEEKKRIDGEMAFFEMYKHK